uniref:Uncharacterized protein n=1 Tax=viral metagenome TaxID=1070528 RepID=A0A6M3JPW5_9ZZZZ
MDMDTEEWMDNTQMLERIITLLNNTIRVLKETQRDNERWITYLNATLNQHMKDTNHHPSNREINSRLLEYEQRIDGKQAFLYKENKKKYIKYDK